MNYDDIIISDFILWIIWKTRRLCIQDDLEHDEVHYGDSVRSGYYSCNSWWTCKGSTSDSCNFGNRIFA